MKKLFISMFLFLLWTFAVSTNFGHAETTLQESNYYAKIKSSSVWLYNNPSTTTELCLLPYSYFVKVNSVDGNYYKVSYKSKTGFVLKNDVILMKGNPIKPYVDISVKPYASINLYTLPSSASSTVCVLSQGQTLDFYGARQGEKLTNLSNEWYYVSSICDGEEKFGYIYSCVTLGLVDIDENKEYFEEVSPNIFNSVSTSSTSFKELSSGTKVLLIISIAVPSILILFFLVKPTRQVAQNKIQERKTIRKTQHGDYFEFDDRDI